MVRQQIDNSTNKFSYAKEQKINLYKPEQILMPLSDFFYAVKEDQMNFNYPAETKNEKLKAEKVNSLAIAPEATNIEDFYGL